jgi:hypothetical protein
MDYAPYSANARSSVAVAGFAPLRSVYSADQEHAKFS